MRVIYCIIIVLDNGPEALPLIPLAGGDSVTNLDLFMALIAVASLALTIYFGKR